MNNPKNSVYSDIQYSSDCRLVDIDESHQCNMSSNSNHYYKYSGVHLKPSKFTLIEIPLHCEGFELDYIMDINGIDGKFQFVSMILASNGISNSNINYTSVVIGDEASQFTDLREWFHILHDTETSCNNKFNNLFEAISDINEPRKNFEKLKNMCRNPKSHINNGRRPILLCYCYNSYL